MHWIAWIFTFIVVIISTLFLIGLMAERRAAGPSLRGAGPEDAEVKIPLVGTNFEMGTLPRFVLAASDGNLPGNEKSQLPLFPKEGMERFSKKYSEWAPSPWDKLPVPVGPLGNMPGESPPPIIRIGLVMSGMDDMIQGIFRMALAPPKDLDLSFKCMRTRIWFGLAPMSEARWKGKGLDEQENIEEALAIIEQVISIHEYLAKPEIQGDIRWIYNKIWAEIDVFQDAVNGLAASRNEPVPAYHLTKLWEEYMTKHLTHMINQSRAFVFGHLKKLDEIWKTRFMDCFHSGRQLSETQATVKIDHYALMIREKIVSLYPDADIYIRQRPEGFFQNGGIHSAFHQDHADKAKCIQIYSQIENQRVAAMRTALQGMIDNRVAQRRSLGPTPDFLEPASLLTDREWGHKGLQQEIENPPQTQMEIWVQQLLSEKIGWFGFVVYRLDYSQDDAEWEKFKEVVENRLQSGWEGVVGAEQVKGKATLHWIDGRVENIPVGDIEAARKDFKTITSLENFPIGLEKEIFLAITPQSLTSFLPTSLPSTGDFGPFLIAAASNTNPTTPDSSSSPTPAPAPPRPAKKDWKSNYDGQFKILDQLIWTDLYATRLLGGQQMEEHWALAAQHPWGVYVGPTTGVRRRMWREMGKGLGLLAGATGRGAVG